MAVSSERMHWRRRLATGTNALLVTIFVIATAGFAVELAGRWRVRWDLSADATSTLQPETMSVLEAADAAQRAVTITAFSAQRKDNEALFRDRMMKDLLRELEYRSDNVTTRFVDFDAERLSAEALGVTRYGTVVVQGGSQRIDLVDREIFRNSGKGADRQLEFLGETAVARAISQVLAEDARNVYLLAGHGEKKLEGGGPDGVALLATMLGNQGYDVAELDMLRDREQQGPPAVPGDADAVLVIGPTAPLTPEEDAAIEAYLQRGGRVGYFVDPGGFVPRFVERAGVTVPSGVVLDQVRVFPYEDRPVLKYGRHAITEDMAEANTVTVVAHAAPLGVARRDDLEASDLLVTSRSGWTERGDERPSAYHEGVDDMGPITVAAAISLRGGAPARLVAVGDADVVTDELLSEGPGNATFAVNVARWLVGDDERMSQVGRPSAIRRLTLSQEQLAMIRWVVLLVLPLVAVLAGGAVWSQRRGR